MPRSSGSTLLPISKGAPRHSTEETHPPLASQVQWHRQQQWFYQNTTRLASWYFSAAIRDQIALEGLEHCVFSDSICIPDNKVTGRIIRQNADGSTAEHQCCHEPWVWWMITKFDWLFQADTLSNCLCVLLLSQVGCVSDHKLPKCQRQSPSGGCTKSNRPQLQTNTADPSSSIDSFSFLLCTLHSDSSI